MSRQRGFPAFEHAAWRMRRYTLAPGQSVWLRAQPGQVACVRRGELWARCVLPQAGLEARWAMSPPPAQAAPQRWHSQALVALADDAWWCLSSEAEAAELLVWQPRPRWQRMLRWVAGWRGARTVVPNGSSPVEDRPGPAGLRAERWLSRAA
ncbi:hypothetical protein [Comamonas serinivorans]|nr:hypothetical protein [Comamonas serinivorans]